MSNSDPKLHDVNILPNDPSSCWSSRSSSTWSSRSTSTWSSRSCCSSTSSSICWLLILNVLSDLLIVRVSSKRHIPDILIQKMRNNDFWMRWASDSRIPPWCLAAANQCLNRRILCAWRTGRIWCRISPIWSQFTRSRRSSWTKTESRYDCRRYRCSNKYKNTEQLGDNLRSREIEDRKNYLWNFLNEVKKLRA